MSLFDKLKSMQSAQANSAGTSPVSTATNDGLSGAICTKMPIESIPTTLAELKAMNTSDFRDPFQTVSLAVAALCVYHFKEQLSIEMLNYLKGPQDLSQYEMQFLKDRLQGKSYLAPSYFIGAVPENDYTPQVPSAINVYKTPHSEDMLSEGYLQLFLKSGGADTARPVHLRYKPSTKQWFLWEYHILTDIRKPKSADAWA